MSRTPGYTFYDFLAELIDKKKFTTILFLTCFSLGTTIVIASVLFNLILQVFRPTLQVNSQGTLEIKTGIFPRDNIYTLLVDPHGWQDTGIKVSPGDEFLVRTSGKTTVGLDVVTMTKNAMIASRYMNEIQKEIKAGKKEEEILKDPKKYKLYTYEHDYKYGWPWRDAKGYTSDDLEGKKIPSSFHLDETLISNRYEPGRLIGYTVNSDKCPELRIREDHIERVIDFANINVKIPSQVEKGSRLCLAINDSIEKEWQYDNAGFLMVTVEKL